MVRAWGFGPDDASSLSAEDVAALQQLADFNAFQLEDRNPPVLRKSIPLAELDFSAIAKGYAVDEIGRLFEAQEITNYLVEIGGEVRARGKHADGRACGRDVRLNRHRGCGQPDAECQWQLYL